MSASDSRPAAAASRHRIVLLVTLFAVLSPLSASAEGRWGVELSSQPSMFLPGAALDVVYEMALPASLVLSASSGLSASYAGSLLHNQWELSSISTVGIRWAPIASGVGATLVLRLLELSDGAPLPGSSLTSLAVGPSVFSHLQIVRGRRIAIALAPRAGLLWDLTHGALSRVPDWYLGLGVAALF